MNKVVMANQGQHPATLAGPALSFNAKVARDLVRAAIATLDKRADTPEESDRLVLDAIEHLKDSCKWRARQVEEERAERAKALEAMFCAA